MRYLPLSICSLAGILMGAWTAPSAHASFGYTATLTDPFARHEVHSPTDLSNVQFVDGSGDTLECDNGGTVLHLVKGSGFAGSNEPDPFNSPFTVTLTINDYDVVTPGVLTFAGTMTGSYSNRRSTIDTTYEVGTKSVTLGSTTYTVTMLPFVAPGPPVVFEQAKILAFITCAPTGTSVSSVSMGSGPVAGRSVAGTVTLNGPAPRGGATVKLTSSAPALSLPPSVTIAEGQTTGQFFAAAEVAATGIQVQAQWNGTNATTNVAIGGSVCGDIDGSGALSLPDAVRLLRSIAGLDAAPNC